MCGTFRARTTAVRHLPIIPLAASSGTAGVKVFNAQMHGAKGSPWIGGTRASSFWRLPGTLAPADCASLTAHVDVFRTWAALAGAEITPELESQVEGRSLLPLLENPKAEWKDRSLFTHTGRWPKGTDYQAAKTTNAAIRTSQYHLVSEAARGKSATFWQLFDVKADPAESKDISAEKPEVVAQMLASYDAWWDSLKGQVDLNEKAVGPKLNPFAKEYWQQFGGGPTEADYARMNPEKAFTFENRKAKK